MGRRRGRRFVGYLQIASVNSRRRVVYWLKIWRLVIFLFYQNGGRGVSRIGNQFGRNYRSLDMGTCHHVSLVGIMLDGERKILFSGVMLIPLVRHILSLKQYPEMD